MGFVARLSGSTAEFMDMYQLMFYGPNMFHLNKSGELEFQLVPALPSWLFVDEESDGEAILDEEGQYTVSFKLFGKVPITYHNPDGSNLYGIPPKKYTIIMKDGSITKIDGEFVSSKLALQIRKTNVLSIDAFF